MGLRWDLLCEYMQGGLRFSSHNVMYSSGVLFAGLDGTSQIVLAAAIFLPQVDWRDYAPPWWKEEALASGFASHHDHSFIMMLSLCSIIVIINVNVRMWCVCVCMGGWVCARA